MPVKYENNEQIVIEIKEAHVGKAKMSQRRNC